MQQYSKVDNSRVSTGISSLDQINKKASDSNSNLNQLELYIGHSIQQHQNEYSSECHRIFAIRDQMLYYKTWLVKLKKNEIIWGILPVVNAIKIEI